MFKHYPIHCCRRECIGRCVYLCMYLFVCMYMYVYARVSVCIRVCMHMSVCMCLYLCHCICWTINIFELNFWIEHIKTGYKALAWFVIAIGIMHYHGMPWYHASILVCRLNLFRLAALIFLCEVHLYQSMIKWHIVLQSPNHLVLGLYPGVGQIHP